MDDTTRIPVIGVTPLWDAARQSVWMLPDYLDGVVAAGGVPVVLPLEAGRPAVERAVSACDGVLFTGGQDVSPSLYGMEDTTGTVSPCPGRDALESMVLDSALRSGKPVLGICRGLQFLCAALDGTLWQDLPSERPGGLVHRQGKPYGVPTHPVSLSGPLSDLLGKDEIRVNSLHHQAVRDLPGSLRPMAFSPDGLVEAAYMPGHPFLWGVQWHPEYMFRTDADSLAVFGAFVRACMRP